MKPNTFFSLFFLLSSVLLFSQSANYEVTDSILIVFKSYDLDKAKELIEELKEENLKKVFHSYWNYNKYGDFNAEFLEVKKEDLSTRNNSIYSFIKAEYYKNSRQKEDSVLIYSYYLKSLKESIKAEDTALATTIFPKILDHLFYLHETNFDEFKKYSDLYQSFRKDKIDNYWYYYYAIVVKLAAYDRTKDDFHLQGIDFKQLYQLANNNLYLQAETYQLEGIYYNYFQKNKQKEAVVCFKKAIENYKKADFHISKSRISGNEINLRIVLFNLKKYKEAIPYFKQALDNSIVEKKPIEEFRANEWLYKCYDNLQNIDSARYYLGKMFLAKDKIDKFKYAKEVKEIESGYDWNQKLDELQGQNSKLQNNVYTLLPILGFVLLLLTFIFYLYQRYKSKSKTLESAQSETLQKLDELKKIVVKNHIILKDKTKVYISDLMYIKAEDHYLRIYTNDTKNAFVRGKLNQIKEELPPNFIQSHRSYIINSNFIKQINNNHIILLDKTEIPLSRSHKNNFKDKP